MKTTTRQPASYRWLAGSYAFWEYTVFGSQLQRCRLAFSCELQKTKAVLLLGDGDGRFSTHLLRNFDGLKITSVDASASMLKAAARRRFKTGVGYKEIQSIHQDFLAWQSQDASFDAVVAQFFFDSFNEDEMKITARKIRNLLQPSGRLFVSEFAVPTRPGWGKVRAKLTVWFLYRVFRILTGLKTQELVDYETTLLTTGYEKSRQSDFLQGGLTTRIYVKS